MSRRCCGVSEHLSDDKIEAVVTVVLQAVDQRLATVREQLVQLTNTIARGHADLQSQIDDVRNLQGARGPMVSCLPGRTRPPRCNWSKPPTCSRNG